MEYTHIYLRVGWINSTFCPTLQIILCDAELKVQAEEYLNISQELFCWPCFLNWLLQGLLPTVCSCFYDWVCSSPHSLDLWMCMIHLCCCAHVVPTTEHIEKRSSSCNRIIFQTDLRFIKNPKFNLQTCHRGKLLLSDIWQVDLVLLSVQIHFVILVIIPKK